MVCRTVSNIATVTDASFTRSINNSECNTQNNIEDDSQNGIDPVIDPTQNINVDVTEKSIVSTNVAEHDVHINSMPQVRETNKIKTFKRARADVLIDFQKDRTERMQLLREIANRSIQPTVVTQNDHIDCFFKSLAATARTLSPWNLVEAKKKLFDVMSELERKNTYEKYTESPIESSSGILSPNTCTILSSTDTSDMEDSHMLFNLDKSGHSNYEKDANTENISLRNYITSFDIQQ